MRQRLPSMCRDRAARAITNLEELPWRPRVYVFGALVVAVIGGRIQVAIAADEIRRWA
jgi:hypothetical protein